MGCSWVILNYSCGNILTRSSKRSWLPSDITWTRDIGTDWHLWIQGCCDILISFSWTGWYDYLPLLCSIHYSDRAHPRPYDLLITVAKLKGNLKGAQYKEWMAKINNIQALNRYMSMPDLLHHPFVWGQMITCNYLVFSPCSLESVGDHLCP